MILTPDMIPSANQILIEMSQADKKELFKKLLSTTNRKGVDSVLSFLDNTDFYDAPSSASYHSNYKGGLLDHVLLVFVTAMKLRDVYASLKPELAPVLNDDSIIITTLLHDLCKTSFYKEKVKYKKDENNNWQSYLGYEINDTFPIGHGEKSVIMLNCLGLELTADEMLAIRWHMGSWDGAMLTNDTKYSYQTAMNSCPLMVLIQTADNTSSLMLEKQNKN